MTSAAKTEAEILAIPSRSLETYELAAENLEAEVWNLCIENSDIPITWIIGILSNVQSALREVDLE